MYKPELAEIVSVHDETFGERSVKTFKVTFINEKVRKNFVYKPGQVCMLSVFGIGESMISITSSPTCRDYLEFSVLKMGKVTTALHELTVGDVIGIRGPYGNGFPVERWEHKNIVFIGGGIGQAPIRSVIQYVLDNREKYGKLQLIYGARTSKDLVFKDELRKLEKRDDIDVRLSIDVEESGWFKINWSRPENTIYDPECRRFTGFVPMIVLVIKPSAENAIALTCGPPIMIKFVVQNLRKLGFADHQIYTTLENKMKCGVGKCGRCNIGNKFVCKDGPVFTYHQILQMYNDF
jgi:NAD(P)H-flavin reductase